MLVCIIYTLSFDFLHNKTLVKQICLSIKNIILIKAYILARAIKFIQKNFNYIKTLNMVSHIEGFSSIVY